MILAVSTTGLLHISQLVFLVLNWRKGTYSLTGGKWDYVGLKETWYVTYTLTLWINWEIFLMMQEFGRKLALSAILLSSTYLHVFIFYTTYLPPRIHRHFLTPWIWKYTSWSVICYFFQSIHWYAWTCASRQYLYTRYVYTTHTSFRCLAQSLISNQ